MCGFPHATTATAADTNTTPSAMRASFQSSVSWSYAGQRRDARSLAASARFLSLASSSSTASAPSSAPASEQRASATSHHVTEGEKGGGAQPEKEGAKELVCIALCQVVCVLAFVVARVVARVGDAVLSCSRALSLSRFSLVLVYSCSPPCSPSSSSFSSFSSFPFSSFSSSSSSAAAAFPPPSSSAFSSMCSYTRTPAGGGLARK
eukprot:3487444-Rhodomonas_salina.1